MRFRCERDVLAEALTTALRAAPTRSVNPAALQGVKVELRGDRLTAMATDLELRIQVDEEVAGEQDGVTVLPARLAADIVRALDAGRVSVVVEDEQATITSGRSEFTVRVRPVEEFPRVTDAITAEVTLEADAFAEALRQVVRAASSDEQRPVLTGVLLASEGEGLRMVATDSYRLAVRDLPGMSVLASGQHVLVPGRALNELGRLLGPGAELVVGLGDREATFRVGAKRLTTRLIEGEFPNYRQLIPQSYPNRLTVSKDALLAAVRRVRLFAIDAAPIRLEMSGEGLELQAIAQDVGEAREHLDAKFEGEPMRVAFNHEYLASGVEAVTGDEVELQTLDPMKPAVVRAPGQHDFVYLLMPVRI